MLNKTESKPLKSAKLVWKNDQNNVQEFVLNQGTIAYIGRDKDNNILLSNPKVSKRHAIIQWKDDAFIITDQGSSNGTQVNGSLIKGPTPLKDGDRVEVGDYVISFYGIGQQTLETLSTRPLSEMEGTKELPVAELQTQKLVESPPEPAKPPAFTEQPTMKYEEKPFTVTPPKPPEPEVKAAPAPAPIPVPAPQATVRAAPAMVEQAAAPEMLTSNIEGIFADLLQNIQSAQVRGAMLKDKGLALKESLESSISQLQIVADEMENLELETNRAGLDELLNQLGKNPNDVKLLMDLAQKSTLISRSLKNYFSQGVMIGKIRDKLNAALKNYIS